MTPEAAARVYDELVPGWREAPLRSGNREIHAPYREDEHPSLHIHPEKLTWYDRGIQEGGGAVDFAKLCLGEEGARDLLRQIGDVNGTTVALHQAEPISTAQAAAVEVLGASTSAQVKALQGAGRILDGANLDALGVQSVRALGVEWLGFKATAAGSWKLWALDRNGRPRLDDKGKLIRRNIGSVSLVTSHNLLAPGAEVPIVHDVEGESDLVALVEAGAPFVLTGTGGASALGGHDAHEGALVALRPDVVLVWGDLDDAGRVGAEKRAAWWLERGVPVRVPTLPADLGDKGDVRDYLNGRIARNEQPAREPMGTLDDLMRLAEAAPLREPPPFEQRGGLISLSDVRPERVSWLWEGRIPLGKLTVIDGDPGCGKSTLTLDLGARVSTGRPMPDGLRGPHGGVLLLSAEDGLGDTIRPRLDAAGANLERVHALPWLKGGRLPQLPADLAAIERAVVESRAVLVVLDPLMAYLGTGVNSYSDQDVRRALAPLAQIGERTGAALVIVRHLNKMTGGSPLYRGGGSIGIVGAARSALLVAKDPEDEDRRVIAPVKSNLGRPAPSLGFRVVTAENGAAAIEWLGHVDYSASTLLATPRTDEEQGALEDASTFLTDYLRSGPQAVNAVKKAARAAGVREHTLERAKAKLGIQSVKDGFTGGWRWALRGRDAQDRQELPRPPSLTMAMLGPPWRPSWTPTPSTRWRYDWRRSRGRPPPSRRSRGSRR